MKNRPKPGRTRCGRRHHRPFQRGLAQGRTWSGPRRDPSRPCQAVPASRRCRSVSSLVSANGTCSPAPGMKARGNCGGNSSGWNEDICSRRRAISFRLWQRSGRKAGLRPPFPGPPRRAANVFNRCYSNTMAIWPPCCRCWLQRWINVACCWTERNAARASDSPWFRA